MDACSGFVISDKVRSTSQLEEVVSRQWVEPDQISSWEAYGSKTVDKIKSFEQMEKE